MILPWRLSTDTRAGTFSYAGKWKGSEAMSRLSAPCRVRNEVLSSSFLEPLPRDRGRHDGVDDVRA